MRAGSARAAASGDRSEGSSHAVERALSERAYLVAEAGTGTGKTYVYLRTALELCRRYGLKPFFEPNDTNPYLEDFYRDMKGFAFRSQIYFLTHKFRLHRARPYPRGQLARYLREGFAGSTVRQLDKPGETGAAQRQGNRPASESPLRRRWKYTRPAYGSHRESALRTSS